MSKVLKVAQFALNFVLTLGAFLACSALIWLFERHVGIDALFGIAAVGLVSIWAHWCPMVTLSREGS